MEQGEEMDVVLRFETREEYEEEIKRMISTKDEMEESTFNESYDSLVDEYLQLCTREKNGI